MKKSTLSVFSLMCGITATTLSAFVLPIALIAKSEAGIALLGFIAVSSVVAGLIGSISSIVKLIITKNEIVQDQEDRIIAKKGFWFSAIPTIVLIFIMMIGST